MCVFGCVCVCVCFLCFCEEWVLADAGGLVLSQSRYVSAFANNDVLIQINQTYLNFRLGKEPLKCH